MVKGESTFVSLPMNISKRSANLSQKLQGHSQEEEGMSTEPLKNDSRKSLGHRAVQEAATYRKKHRGLEARERQSPTDRSPHDPERTPMIAFIKRQQIVESHAGQERKEVHIDVKKGRPA